MIQRLPSRLLIGLIGLYQVTLSPVLRLVSQCRHMPSCSAFACDAIGQHGAWVGGWMSLARVCRCRPGGSWGYDPAPAARPAGRWFLPWTYGDWRGGYRPPYAEDPPGA